MSATVLDAPALPAPITGPAAIREIFVPTDLSPHGQAAVAHARVLAESLGARVTLYHAIVGPSRVEGDIFTSDAEVAAGLAERRAYRVLSGQRLRLEVPSAIVVHRVHDLRAGLFADLAAAAPDLVVIGTHGHEGLSWLHPGSLGDAIVRDTHRAVLCVHGTDETVAPYKRILVPVDLSRGEDPALRWAALIARAFGAEVIGMHVVPRAAPRSVPADERAFEARLDQACTGLKTRALVPERGSEVGQIVRMATTEHADLVVVSRHGPDTLLDHLLGWKAERVARHSPSPVLVV